MIGREPENTWRERVDTDVQEAEYIEIRSGKGHFNRLAFN